MHPVDNTGEKGRSHQKRYQERVISTAGARQPLWL